MRKKLLASGFVCALEDIITNLLGKDLRQKVSIVGKDRGDAHLVAKNEDDVIALSSKILRGKNDFTINQSVIVTNSQNRRYDSTGVVKYVYFYIDVKYYIYIYYMVEFGDGQTVRVKESDLKAA